MLTHGIDLSHWQSPSSVPWGLVGKQCTFVICRATYGATRDRHVVEHVKRARDAGCAVGLYMFFRFVQNLDDQIAAFCAAAEAAGYTPGDIAPAIDVEDDPKICDVAPGWDSSVFSIAQALGERFGTKPIIYITQRDWTRLGRPEWVLEHPLWVAHFTQAPKPATPAGAPWLIWQNRVGPYDPSGPGGSHQPGLFDHNLCCGDLPRITRTTSGATEPVSSTLLREPSWDELRARNEYLTTSMLDELAHESHDKELNT